MGKKADEVEISTSGGLTYALAIPSALFAALPAVGRDVELYTVLIARDDGLDLYGFGSQLERELFLRLKAASGVGPRLALTLLGSMTPGQLVETIRTRDLARLQSVNGVGKK
ncbi:MAG: Holliday junction branch migration protein RuvA, partial [Gammaproteobacteria bacterium]|nr:Holliday junction branch migration protein RuvA [Gammaproteobacteria bacterium]NIV21786.1 Holliday junction branch migration protein RuvA [Gammaproteobacteria bacterium]NIY33408.1 Holliday junction branch migration protein RuvA [Gammaproteobacteria bacterium]